MARKIDPEEAEDGTGKEAGKEAGEDTASGALKLLTGRGRRAERAKKKAAAADEKKSPRKKEEMLDVTVIKAEKLPMGLKHLPAKERLSASDIMGMPEDIGTKDLDEKMLQTVADMKEQADAREDEASEKASLEEEITDNAGNKFALDEEAGTITLVQAAEGKTKSHTFKGGAAKEVAAAFLSGSAVGDEPLSAAHRAFFSKINRREGALATDAAKDPMGPAAAALAEVRDSRAKGQMNRSLLQKFIEETGMLTENDEEAE